MLACVFPLVSTRSLARPFTYDVPEGTGKGAVVAIRLGRARHRGVVVETAGRQDEVLKILPALIIPDDELVRGLEIIADSAEDALEVVGSGSGGTSGEDAA